MEARLATMEQLVEKLTAKVETLRKENETLRVATNKPETTRNPATPNMWSSEKYEEVTLGKK